MIKSLSREELEKSNQKINHCLYLSPENTVIKDCWSSSNCPHLVGDRINFVASMPPTSGMTFPISVMQNEKGIYGYEMEYLKGYFDLHDFLYSGDVYIPFPIKRKILLSLIDCLKTLNKEYAVSDINVNNIMINANGEARLIDWENGVPLGTDYPTLCLYELKECKNLVQADSFKLFVCALSLLYECDFGSIMMHMPLNKFLEMIENLRVDPAIRSFIADFSYELYIGGKRVVYFDDYIKCIKNISKRDIDRTKDQLLQDHYNYTLSLIKR